MKPARVAWGVLALGGAVWLGVYLSGERSRILELTPLPAVHAQGSISLHCGNPLVRQPGRVERREFRTEFLAAGLQVFCLSIG